jgi:hypothetical protein
LYFLAVARPIGDERIVFCGRTSAPRRGSVFTGTGLGSSRFATLIATAIASGATLARRAAAAAWGVIAISVLPAIVALTILLAAAAALAARPGDAPHRTLPLLGKPQPRSDYLGPEGRP